MKAWTLLLLLGSLPCAAAEPVCAGGRSKGPDTQGHCCWPGQAWSVTRATCVGIPSSCPAGLSVDGDACACPAGQSIGPDTQGHCCWPAQAWSSARNVCVGIPQCPAGMTASTDACVTQSAATAAAAPVSAAGAPAGPGEFQVKFEGDNADDNYTVVAKTPAGRKSCKLPCSLALATGDADIQVSGDSAFERTIDVPEHPVRAHIGHDVLLPGIIAGAMLVLASVGGYYSLDELAHHGFDAPGVGIGVLSTLAVAVAAFGIVRLITHWNFIEVTAEP